jgi:hypothetical protein
LGEVNGPLCRVSGTSNPYLAARALPYPTRLPDLSAVVALHGRAPFLRADVYDLSGTIGFTGSGCPARCSMPRTTAGGDGSEASSGGLRMIRDLEGTNLRAPRP